MARYLMRGLVLWLGGTILLRGLPAGRMLAGGGRSAAALVVLYAASFALLFFALGRPIVRAKPPADARLALIALVLPTLVLDAFSSAFFSAVFPNLPASGAGVFGGWMLICCAGCLAAAFLFRPAALR
jgi:hypothetical protein